jgi:2-polyprenyl-3-methyl-5-hydroxy-6-metoxy-1,4-benzoquinol methylase
VTQGADLQDYNTWHSRLGVDVDSQTPWHQLVLAHVNAEQDLRGKRVLEIACGRGGLAMTLAGLTEPPPRLVAADFSITAVAMGKAYADVHTRGAIKWEVADAQALCHPDAAFDTVISCETVEHVPHPAVAIAEFARVLRPGGRLLLTTPNYLGFMGLYRGYVRLMGRPFQEMGQPINRFTTLPRTLAWLREAGLTTTRVEGRGHHLPWPGRHPIPFPALDRIVALKWFARHSLVVAEKPHT